MGQDRRFEIFSRFIRELDPELLDTEPILKGQAAVIVEVPMSSLPHPIMTFRLVNTGLFNITKDRYWHRIGIHGGPLLEEASTNLNERVDDIGVDCD
jgi:hypothetical protein